MKLAHFSDIHFFHLHKSPLQFFSKRFLGNFHYFFKRRRLHDFHLAYKVLPLLKQEGVSHLLISGDFTSSASRQEFQKMQEYVKHAIDLGFFIYTLPGNHDVYTKAAYRNQAFFSYLGGLVPFRGEFSYDLTDQGVAAFHLKESWWLILLNCSLPTPWHRANGLFSKERELALASLLKTLPENSSLMVMSHFPFDLYKYPKAHLKRGDKLQELLLQDRRVRLYLHGHRHMHRIETLEKLTIADSGSISLIKNSSFNIIDLLETGCNITPYKKNHNTWSAQDVLSLV